MAVRTNKLWRLVKGPVGDVIEGCLAYEEGVAVPEVKDGQVLLRTLFLSLDPTNRIWMSDMDQYMPPVELGQVMRGLLVSVVEESKSSKFPKDSIVTGVGGWQLYEVTDGASYGIINPNPKLPLDAYLSAISMLIGGTAYFGLLDIGQPKAGETLVVSGAAGAVGSLVGQIGKIKGLRVVGIAGSDEKCAWLKNELGFDAAINYKTEDVSEALRVAAPKGVDVYFENVGGKILDAVLGQCNNFSRVSICGLISGYNASAPIPGPYNFAQILMHRIKVQGFIVIDYAARMGEALQHVEQWVLEGKLKYKSDIAEGLETAPTTLKKLFNGTNDGKLMVHVSKL